MIRNPDDKELKYFQLFLAGGVDNTRWKKVQSDPMLIFLSGNRSLQTNTMIKACFPLGEFFRANREKSNLIGWRQTLTTSPANHIRLLLVRAKKIAKWKTGLNGPQPCTNGNSLTISIAKDVAQKRGILT